MNQNYKGAFAVLASSAFFAGGLWVASILMRSTPPEQKPLRVNQGRVETTTPIPNTAPFASPTKSTSRQAAALHRATSDEPSLTEDRSADRDVDVFEDSTGDLEIYRNAPMSAVPHVVARGWGVGAGSQRPGVVGAVVIVDPDISDASLEQLVRDIQAYHSREDAVSIRIMNDGHAATYDRHSDGGELAQRHLVAQIVRNEEVDINEMRIGERILEP